MNIRNKNIDNIIWPVPQSYKREIPKKGISGCFWDQKSIGLHCGVDIYAPLGSEVVAISAGIVVDVGVFTSPEMKDSWLTTYYIIIRSPEKIIMKYASLDNTIVRVGANIQAGQSIGTIGKVLEDQIENSSDNSFDPNKTRLHLEIYKAPFTTPHPYQAGYYSGQKRPEFLIDPNLFFNNVF